MTPSQIVKPTIDIDELSKLITEGLKEVLDKMKINLILSADALDELVDWLENKVYQTLACYNTKQDTEPECQIELECPDDITDQTDQHSNRTTGLVPCIIIGCPCILAPRGGPQADCHKLPCPELTAYKRQQAYEGNLILLGNELEELIENTLTKAQPPENLEYESLFEQLNNDFADYIVTHHGFAVATKELLEKTT